MAWHCMRKLVFGCWSRCIAGKKRSYHSGSKCEPLQIGVGLGWGKAGHRDVRGVVQKFAARLIHWIADIVASVMPEFHSTAYCPAFTEYLK